MRWFYGKSVSITSIPIAIKAKRRIIPLEGFRELLGIESDEYPAFSIFNRAVIKPAIKEINDLTSYHIAVEQKRIGRRIGELKFCITKATSVEQIPIQESLFRIKRTFHPLPSNSSRQRSIGTWHCKSLTKRGISSRPKNCHRPARTLILRCMSPRRLRYRSRRQK